MSTPNADYVWHPMSYARPERGDVNEGDQDQYLDINGTTCGAWASIGPDARIRPDGWSWTILNFDEDNAGIASGHVATEGEAKAAVEAWASDIPVEYRAQIDSSGVQS